MQNEPLLSRNQAAELLGVKPQTMAVWACTKRYLIPYIKIGRCVKYRREDLQRFIAAHAVDEVAFQ